MDIESSILADFSDSELSTLGSTPPRPDWLSPSPPPPSHHAYSHQAYPSPPPSQTPKRLPGHQTEEHCAPDRSSDTTPKKRRRINPRPPRTTTHLHLADTLPSSAEQPQLDLLLKTLRNRRKIVVVAGAGISVSAGIPDFRSADGLFNTLRREHKLRGSSGKELFDASVYNDHAMTSSFHDMVRSLSAIASEAKPTCFHRLLAKLAEEKRLMRLYTQNVDGIDTALPELETQTPLNPRAPWPRTIQLHGGLNKMVCQKCSHTADLQADLFQGPDPPSCPICFETDRLRGTTGQRPRGVGRLRPRIVLYNEHNPDEDAIGSVVTSDLRARPDALLVVGTSLKIPGVRRIVREMSAVVRDRRDGVAVWINRDNAPCGREFENCWDLVVHGDSDDVARHFNQEAAPVPEPSQAAVQVVIPDNDGLSTLKSQRTSSPGQNTDQREAPIPLFLDQSKSKKAKQTKLCKEPRVSTESKPTKPKPNPSRQRKAPAKPRTKSDSAKSNNNNNNNNSTVTNAFRVSKLARVGDSEKGNKKNKNDKKKGNSSNSKTNNSVNDKPQSTSISSPKSLAGGDSMLHPLSHGAAQNNGALSPPVSKDSDAKILPAGRLPGDISPFMD